jgi:hypothetical protein
VTTAAGRLGKHRVLVHPLQHPQGEPTAPRGWHAAHSQTRPAQVAPGHLLVLGNQQHELWKDFLDVAYWNVELEE